MRWIPFAEIEGCGVLEMDPHVDERGLFMEMWNRKSFAVNEIPLPWNWPQDNLSYSHRGVLRGFHIQRNNPQGKLITCISGKILDVCLDLRPQSSTFMKMTRVILEAADPKSFWLPPGTAHAFLAMEDSLVHYKCSTPYDKESDGGVNTESPELAMVWPPGEFYRSNKDKDLPMLMDYIRTLT